ncbi:MAG: S-layer protein, partial [Candidatus Aenigmatarchaeota archaeon]
YSNATAESNGGEGVYVFYEDTDNKVQYDSVTDGTANDNFADVTYQDVTLDLEWANVTAAGGVELFVNEDGMTLTGTTAGNYSMDIKFSGNAIDGLGTNKNKEDGEDLSVYGTEVGTREESVLTHIGAVLVTPKSNTASDKVVIDVPSVQVKGILTVGPVGEVAAGEEVTYTEAIPITSSVAALDTEVDKTASDLILVGGPCANDLVEELAQAGKFPYTCDTWPTDKFAVVSVIADAFTTGKTAVVIAGTTRTETNMGTDAVQQGLLDGRTETQVKITSLTTAGVTELV